LFARTRPTLACLLRWKETSDRVTELKAWVRVVVTAYVFTVVPLLLFMFSMMLINAPRIMGTAYDSFIAQYHKLGSAGALDAVIGVVQMAILVLPALALVATFWLFFRRIGGSVWTRTEGKPAARGAFVVVVAGAAAVHGWIWWPSNGDYKAIQPGERGTVQGAVQQFAAVPTGHPAAPKTSRERTGATTPKPSQQQQTRTQTSENQTTTDLTTTTTTTTSTNTTPATTTTATTTPSTTTVATP
jgi:putative peptide zinc metalloprotease protein